MVAFCVLAELVCEALWGQWVFCVVFAPSFIGCIQIFGAGFIIGLECHITLRIEKVQNVVDIPNCGRDIVLGSLADGEVVVIGDQPSQSLQHPEKDPLFFGNQFLGKKWVIEPIRRLVLGGQNDLAAKETVAAVVKRSQCPVAKAEEAYIKQPLIALFFLPFQIHPQFCGHDRFDIVGFGQHSKATILVRIAQVLGHLSYSLGQYKEALTKFAEQLNEPGYDRTPDGYAAMFGQFFKGEPTLSLDNPAWMTLTNASVQYVAAIRPGKTEPQLVKRMHYVSFVGMFRSDLFEGLCVGHAPKKCPICGRWFLTIDARHTKYCGGLAPGDQRGRTCRQIGNLRGREQRELADDHPVKAIYTRRMNTILQNTRRGKLDEGTAAAMKKLAKDKMLRALSDQRYASTVYEQEMTQDALLKAAQKK